MIFLWLHKLKINIRTTQLDTKCVSLYLLNFQAHRNSCRSFKLELYILISDCMHYKLNFHVLYFGEWFWNNSLTKSDQYNNKCVCYLQGFEFQSIWSRAISQFVSGWFQFNINIVSIFLIPIDWLIFVIFNINM